MKFNLENKHAVVSGAGSGIGKAIATTLAAAGARVYLLDLDQANGNAAAAEICGNGGDAVAHLCNVADMPDVQRVIDEIAADSPIDILINNAGIGHIGNLEATTEADMDRLFGVNVKGVYHCLYACVPQMKKKGGVIVNMASVAALVGLADRFAYSMTKGAVLAMTYSVARDYLDNGIRCNSISPARVHTPFVDQYLAKNYPGQEQEMFDKLARTQPIGRMGTPEEIANLALYLCSDEAAFITGTDFPIDGGFVRLNT